MNVVAHFLIFFQRHCIVGVGAFIFSLCKGLVPFRRQTYGACLVGGFFPGRFFIRFLRFTLALIQSFQRIQGCLSAFFKICAGSQIPGLEIFFLRLAVIPLCAQLIPHLHIIKHRQIIRNNSQFSVDICIRYTVGIPGALQGRHVCRVGFFILALSKCLVRSIHSFDQFPVIGNFLHLLLVPQFPGHIQRLCTLFLGPDIIAVLYVLCHIGIVQFHILHTSAPLSGQKPQHHSQDKEQDKHKYADGNNFPNPPFSVRIQKHLIYKNSGKSIVLQLSGLF